MSKDQFQIDESENITLEINTESEDERKDETIQDLLLEPIEDQFFAELFMTEESLEDLDEYDHSFDEVQDVGRKVSHRYEVLPYVPVRELVVFPRVMLTFDVGRARSRNAVRSALEDHEGYMVISAQRSKDMEWPDRQDIYFIGTLVRIREVLEIQENVVRVRVQGLSRVRIHERICDDASKFDTCRFECLTSLYEENDIKQETMRRQVVRALHRFAKETGRYAQETIETMAALTDGSYQCDVVASYIRLPFESLQTLLATVHVQERQQRLLAYIEKEKAIAEYENELSIKVKEAVEKDQRDYYLREQLKVIHKELGDEANAQEEVEQYLAKLDRLKLPDAHREKLAKEIKRLPNYPSHFPEAATLRTYLETVFDLPWGKLQPETLRIEKVRKQLDKDHYGLEDVKTRILEYMAVRLLHQKQSDEPFKAPILCFVGPPGVGKTSIAQSIAKALGRAFVRMSLGGVRDEAEIRGHRRTYIGAIPGRLIGAIQQAKSDNPVILLDEIDKLGSDFRGDPASAMLEVLDPEQNNTFRDHYLEIPYDLSKVLFITTANQTSTIPQPLLDRMELIELSGYTEEEKFHIAKLHLLVKQMHRNALPAKSLKVNPTALYDVIRLYTREAGVRQLDRELAKLCRRSVLKLAEIAEGQSNEVSEHLVDHLQHQKHTITRENLPDYLGRPKYRYDVVDKKDPIGVVTGLAWTAVGGDTLTIEVSTSKGSGKIELTGSLGDVMKESAKVSLAYVRSRQDVAKVCPDFPEKMDIHIHVPEGAVPKDGPSAGVTLATALYSALLQKKVHHDLAMTGEITIRGRVLPIGGLKEKVIAAHRAGVKKVLIPVDNKRDIEDIPESVKKQVEIVPVSHANEVFEHAIL